MHRGQHFSDIFPEKVLSGEVNRREKCLPGHSTYYVAPDEKWDIMSGWTKTCINCTVREDFVH